MYSNTAQKLVWNKKEVKRTTKKIKSNAILHVLKEILGLQLVQ